MQENTALITDLFSTAYCGPVDYYQKWYRSQQPTLEVCENYCKQTWRNRCLIATANGSMPLTLPIEKSSGSKAIKDIRLSEHGNWRHMHWYSIESAYNSSPFFEYYQDDLKPHFEKSTSFLLDFNEGLHRSICELLSIDADFQRTEEFMRTENLPDGTNDWRTQIQPGKLPLQDKEPFIIQPYYQVFERKFGFQANLSILDLLFNMGPEAILYL